MLALYDTQRISGKELEVNNCGCQTVFDTCHSVTRRRVDYTLMYLSQGKATVYIDGAPQTLSAGQALLYLPSALQRHIYLRRDNCINKFVHFSGSFCSVLEGAPARIITVSAKNEFESDLDRLIRAYCRIDAQRDMLCDGYLRAIIALLIDSEQLSHPADNVLQDRVQAVINVINTHINEAIDLDNCAEKCFVSRQRFNHLFKEQTGLAPLRYINQVKIERAKQLLCDSGLTVGECAETLGFTDVNYFGRVFKKHVGLSPANYRKRS